VPVPVPAKVIDVAPADAVPLGVPLAVPLASVISGGTIVKFSLPDLCLTINYTSLSSFINCIVNNRSYSSSWSN